MYQDIFDNTTSIAYVNGHILPLGGFYKLNQVIQKLSLDPVGTSVQMKMNLIAEIQAKGKDTSLTMWDISPFLDKITPMINNIIAREPSLKASLEMEINMAVGNDFFGQSHALAKKNTLTKTSSSSS